MIRGRVSVIETTTKRVVASVAREKINKPKSLDGNL
jgi:hypothetical protein